MHESIRTNHGAAEFLQLSRNRALAGSYAAGDSKYWLFPGIAHTYTVGITPTGYSHLASIVY